MSSRFSPPPLKPYQDQYHPRQRSRHQRKWQWLYGAIALIITYLWYTSKIQLFPRRSPVHRPSLIYKHVDWTHFAYSQYATNSAYLCNAVMIFESLARLGSKADRILLYPLEWDLIVESPTDRDSQLLVMARDEYDVKLIPVEIPQADGDAWHGSFAKFAAWQQTQYERILHIDSDVTLTKHMDDLFMLPRAPVAMLRAYWDLPKKKLSSLFVLLEPSETEYQRLMTASRADNNPNGDYDMDILDRFYSDSAIILPHQQYGLLTGEFRSNDHSNFIGNDFDKFDADRVFGEASLVHFSDWPLPKPWIMWPHKLLGEMLPRCFSDRGVEINTCKEKEIWMGLYEDFRKRRKEVCALLSEPAPEWPPPNATKQSE